MKPSPRTPRQGAHGQGAHERAATTPFTALLAATLLTAALQGCGTAPQKPAEATPEPAALIAAAEALVDEGKQLSAVRHYTELARAAATPVERQNWLLHAAEILFDHGYPELGLQRLAQLQTAPLDPSLAERERLVEAQAALAQQQPDAALALLNRAAPPVQIELQRRELQTRADAHALRGDIANLLRARVALHRLLDDQAAIARNRSEIWRQLEPLDDASLAGVASSPGDDDYRGWVELVYSLRDAQRRGGNLGELMTRWRGLFPGHPADGEFSEQLLGQILESSAHPNSIALLLPLNGRLANAAAALRDGFLAAYYADQREGLKPDVNVYDTGEDAANIWQVYNRALNEGARFVVGPLRKAAVESLASTLSLPRRTLALNYVGDPSLVPPVALSQFGLLPEDEARAAAAFAAQQGRGKAVAMLPEGEWGDRVAGAFGAELNAQGGRLLAVQRYQRDSHDFAVPIRRLLHLTESAQRNALLERLLGQNLEFEPRRRQDVDLIFLAAGPREGRLIKPQFKFHHAGDLPVYSISRIFTGKVSPRDDRDLDGLRFVDIPWLLDSDAEGFGLRERVEAAWPQAGGGLARLYAMGADAYALIPHIEQMHRDPGLRLEGFSGTLSMLEDGRIHREPLWAEFRNGRPVALRDMRAAE